MTADAKLSQEELDQMVQQPEPPKGPPLRGVLDTAKSVGLGALGGGAALVGAMNGLKPVGNMRKVD